MISGRACINVWLSRLLILPFTFFSGIVIGQQEAADPAPNRPNEIGAMEPSPLSQYSAVPETANPFNRPANLDDLAGDQFETRNVDLSRAIRNYSEVKNCSLDEAFAAIVSYLRMSPLGEDSPQPMVGVQAFYRILKQDVYQVTAPRQYFDELPSHLACVENGLRNIQIDVHFLSVWSSELESIRELLIPGTYKAYTNRIPISKPIATQASPQNENRWKKIQLDAHGTFVIASETRTKVYPTFMGRMDKTGLDKLIDKVKGDTRIDLAKAPSVNVLPGQSASISDTATRPFVVGINTVKGDFAVANQPVIQPLEDGTMLKLRATVDDGKIRLDGDLALSEIVSVESFDLLGDKQAQSISVQIPEQKLREVHWSTQVEDGATVLIDPVFARKNKVRSTKRFSNKLVDRETRVLVLVTPRFIEATDKSR